MKPAESALSEMPCELSHDATLVVTSSPLKVNDVMTILRLGVPAVTAAVQVIGTPFHLAENVIVAPVAEVPTTCRLMLVCESRFEVALVLRVSRTVVPSSMFAGAQGASVAKASE